MFDVGKQRALIRQAMGNPAQASAILAQMDRSLSLGPHPNALREGPARTGATKTIRPTDPGPITVAAPNTSAAVPLTIRSAQGGRMLALYGQVSSGVAADAASISLQILTDGGRKSLFTNGDSPAFVPYLCLFGSIGQSWYPINVPVAPDEQWSIQWKNEGYSGNTITPTLVMSFLDYAAP